MIRYIILMIRVGEGKAFLISVLHFVSARQVKDYAFLVSCILSLNSSLERAISIRVYVCICSFILIATCASSVLFVFSFLLVFSKTGWPMMSQRTAYFNSAAVSKQVVHKALFTYICQWKKNML